MKRKQQAELHWKHKPIPELVRLAWPITVSMLSYSTMTLVDTLFVGRLGANALAGVGLGGVAAFTVICFGLGVLRSVKVLVSQAVGAGQRRSVPAFVAAGLVCAAALGALFIALAQLLAQALPALAQAGGAGLSSAGDAPGAQAASYLVVRTLGAPIVLAGVALRETRYGLGDSRSPMRAALSANALNILLDALFIFGLGLGVVGAAWATVSAQLVETALLAGVQRRDGFGFGGLQRRHVAEIFRLGLPLGLQFVLEVGAFSVLVVILARISAVDVAAHQIALQVAHFSFLPAFALGEAASVLAGQAVGANQDRLVRAVARRALVASSAYTGSCAIGMALFAEPLASLFTTDPAVRAVTVRLFWVAAMFQVFDGANTVARAALRGAGDVRFAAVVAVAIAWIFTPPLTWLLGHELGMGAVGGWIGICAEIVVGAVVLWWRLERGHWRLAARECRARLESVDDAEPAIASAAIG
jgi:multidrug resistance protein, MATE family